MINMIFKYFDPKNDFAFKKLFGEEKHKNLCISLLNNVLRLKEGELIDDLEFLDTRQTAEIDARKESIVDVLICDQKGVRYIVEMQVAKIAGFEKRAQYYAAKTYCSNFRVGAKYYNLKKVIFLAFTDYIVFPNKKEYRSDHVILDNKTFENDLKDFSFTFIELPKFNKELQELETLEEKWCYFLKHAEDTKDIDEGIKRIPEMMEAYDVLERTKWTEWELYLYEKRAMDAADEQGIIDAAVEDARAGGLAEGMEKGMTEGMEKEKLRVSCLAN